MNVLYEEDGGFKTAAVLSDQGASLQVEAPHGKRSKIKSSHVLLSFAAPRAGELLPQAEALAAGFEVDFLWECAGSDEFGFEDFALEYFGHKPTPAESVAILLSLHAAPAYFHRKGRGRFRAAPAEILQAALAANERKRLQAERQQAWTATLLAGGLPDSMAARPAALLVNPDKNSLEYKALQAACEQCGATPARLLLANGAFGSAEQLHRACFEAADFPRGTGFPVIDPAANAAERAVLDALPLAGVEAFSIDDTTTTEIDDAFSVVWAADAAAPRATIGIHIAAPGLFMRPGDALDALARERLSTVYMPGDKITMLPDALVEQASLTAGRTAAALSLYVDVDPETGELLGEPTSRIDRVRVASNLRHNLLDGVVTAAALASGSPEAQPYPHARELALLWRVSRLLAAQREQVRGKPEQHHRIDYSFYVDAGRVSIVPRRRDAPLDLLVAEFMILANQTWGGLLHEHGVPGIYRVQPPLGRVRMATQAAPHAGLGVPQYAWSTSPLRRYVDLVNQWQLLAVLQQCPVPFPPNDAELFAVVSAFDATYKSYADFQSRMERFWCFRWLAQEGVSETGATVLRDELVRVDDLPLVLRIAGLNGQTPGTRIRLLIGQADELELLADCRLLGIVAEPSAVVGDTPSPDVPNGEETDHAIVT
ncbi:MAG: ribonuclease catalytic domain-containing protein [Burkholderiaceae bacterium]